MKEGFLLNHLISELLPKGGGGYRYSNSDPLTGQAAWFDLRVKIEKAESAGTSPLFEPLGEDAWPERPETLAFGRQWKEPAE